MPERLPPSDNELVIAVPHSVREAFDANPDLAKGINEASKESHDAIMADIFKKEPHNDTDKNGWLWLLGYSYLGYATQQMLIDNGAMLPPGDVPEGDFKRDFIKALQSQLTEDAPGWGDTWKKRPIKGQLERTYARFRDYKDKYENGSQAFTWLKVAGNIIIDLYRLDHPDYQK
jgi:hypothetical protein